MTTIRARRVKLGFRYLGAGPELGGVAELSIRVLKGATLVRYRPDVTDEGSEPQIVLDGPGSDDWRSVLRAIDQHQAYALFTDGETGRQYPWPDRMEGAGTAGVFGELVALAWAGPPVSDVALALTKATDRQLLSLHTSAGPFTTRKFLRVMIRCDEALRQAGYSLGDVVSKASTGQLDLPAIRLGTRRLTALAAAESRLGAARAGWAVFGFEAEIERLMGTWRSQAGATSANTAIRRGAEASAIRGYLEAFVAGHGALPVGRHTVTCSFGASAWAFSVDLDQV